VARAARQPHMTPRDRIVGDTSNTAWVNWMAALAVLAAVAADFAALVT